MPSPFDLGGLSGKELARRVVSGISKNDLTGRAAELAYYFFVAIFPMLIFLLGIFGILASTGSTLRAEVVGWVGRVMPSAGQQIVHRFIDETARSSGTGKLSFGIIVALWSASTGMAGLSDTLNAVYEVREERSYIAAKLNAIWLTVACSVLVVAAAVVVLYGGSLANLISSHIGLSGIVNILWKVVQWPVALFFLLLSFGLVYYFAPDLKKRKWHWISPGAIAGIILWLIVSFALRVYLHFFSSYSKAYGSIGAVLILLLWLYVTGLAILIGGEINAEIETAAAQRGEPEAQPKGKKAA